MLSRGRRRSSASSQSGSAEPRPLASTTRSAGSSTVLGVSAARPHGQAADVAMAVQPQGAHLVAGDELDARGLLDPPADHPLDQDAAGRGQALGGGEASHPPVGWGQPPHVRRKPDRAGTRRDQVRLDARQQLLDRAQPTRPEGVQVPCLRYARAEIRLVGQLVPFDHGHFGEVVAERLGGEDAGHAATDHGGVPGAVGGHEFPWLTCEYISSLRGRDGSLEIRQEAANGSVRLCSVGRRAERWRGSGRLTPA